MYIFWNHARMWAWEKIRGGTLENRKVAGIVMLHLEDGAKRFLLHATGSTLELAYADYSEGKTGLANILELLKSTVELDVKKIEKNLKNSGKLSATMILKECPIFRHFATWFGEARKHSSKKSVKPCA